MPRSEGSLDYVLYLAVLPRYRSACIQILTDTFGSRLGIFVSPAHLDRSIKTGVPAHLYEETRMVRIFNEKAFFQYGAWRPAIRAKTAVLDLNPRSLTAWILLIIRKALKRRTLVWGHIHPQGGATKRTAFLRRFMRRIANGTISYTYRDAEKALSDIPESAVWVAPNSLYKAESISPAASSSEPSCSVLYVGRFAKEKKVSVLIAAFAHAAKSCPGMRLVLIGGGEEEVMLKQMTIDLGLESKVEFPGWIDELEKLAPYYSRSFCSASPGFAGLGLTQSLGFGVPMVIADDEPHSPEIELQDFGGVDFFQANSPENLAELLLSKWKERENIPCGELSDFVRRQYSAEAMANGIERALTDRKGLCVLP